MPGVPVRPWRLPRVPHYTLHTRLRVQRAPGIPHALNGREIYATTRAQRAARCERAFVVGARHCEERLVRRSSTSEGGSDEAIHTFFAAMDCFAEPVIGRAFARPVGSQ